MSVGEVCYPSPKNNDFKSQIGSVDPDSRGQQLKSDGLVYCQNASNR